MTVQTVRDASGQCCELHRHGAATLGWVDTERGRKLLWRAPCCDPDDCGPCCERCPTCPTLRPAVLFLCRRTARRARR